MKRTPVFFLFLIFFFTNSFAQLKKGNRMIGASIGSIFYNNGSSDVSFPGSTQGYEGKVSSFGASINPSMGWFVSDDVVVGGNLNINPNKQKNTYEFNGTTFQKDELSTLRLGLGIFARKYFEGKNILPFGQLSLDLGLSNRNSEGFLYGGISPIYKISYEGKSSGGFFATAGLTGGITRMISPSVGLDIFVGYRYNYDKSSMKTTTVRDNNNDGTIEETAISDATTKTTTHGFQVGLGFQVFLQKKDPN